jgi:hypothetical protein
VKFIVLLIASCAACGAPTVGPFVPGGAQVCNADSDCRDGYVCQFPRAGSRAVCTPGSPPEYLPDPYGAQ